MQSIPECSYSAYKETKSPYNSMRKSPPSSTRPPLIPAGRTSQAKPIVLSDSVFRSQQATDRSNHMTQTDFAELLVPDKQIDPSLFTWKTRRRVRGLQSATHRKTSSVPEDVTATLTLTPLNSSRAGAQQDSRHRFDPLISRMCYSVRGSGFRLQTSKLQVPHFPQTVSLRHKLSTLVKGRRLVLSTTAHCHRVSMCEATTFTESP